MASLNLRIVKVVKVVSQPSLNTWLNLMVFSNTTWKFMSAVVLVQPFIHLSNVQFLVIMADHSQKGGKNFAIEVKNAKDFSIIADSISDARLSCMDLLTVILSYVKPDGEIIDSFSFLRQ
jgi:hypothetical protein